MKDSTKTTLAIITIILVLGGLAIWANTNAKDNFNKYLNETCDYEIIIKHSRTIALDCYDYKAQKYMQEDNRTGVYCFVDIGRNVLYNDCSQNVQNASEVKG